MLPLSTVWIQVPYELQSESVVHILLLEFAKIANSSTSGSGSTISTSSYSVSVSVVVSVAVVSSVVSSTTLN